MFRIPYLSTSFLLILISISGFCNSKLLDGYYVNQSGDTVTCKIVYGDWSLNPRSIMVDLSGKRQIFQAHDIKAFGVAGYGDYRSATVSYHLNPISGSNLPEEFSDKLDTGTYFLKVITAGYYALFELNFSQRSYYFLSEQDSSIYELVYRVKQTEQMQVEDPQYKKTIFALYNKEGNSADYFGTIERTFYSGSDLKPLITRLNKNHSVPEKISAKIHVNRFEMGLYGGMILHSFPSTLDGQYSTGNNFTPSVSATGGIYFQYTIPSRFNAFSIGFSLGYDHYSFAADRSGTSKFYQSANWNGTTDYSEHLFSSNTMLLGNLYFSYVMNPLSQVNFT